VDLPSVGLWVVLGVAVFLAAAWFGLFYYIKLRFFDKIVRIFQEKPLFIIPRGQPVANAEEVTFRTADGLALRGCYLPAARPRRRGVILFGLEFGSNRWASVPYTQFLRDAGFDVFTFEPRNQGESDSTSGYEPLQWVTDYEVRDFRAALKYLQSRPDADPRGVGFFGISKGGGAGLLAAAGDDYVRCFVTDGIFAAHTTMVPYMQKWIKIYSDRDRIIRLIPRWYYAMFARMGIRQTEKERHCRFPHLEHQIHRLAPRPLFMIHGGGDTYIKPEMAQELFDRAGGPKEFWLVEGAKHNQSFHIAHEEYKRRVLDFFVNHLSNESEPDDALAVPAEKKPEPAAARP
jgi:alpha-beta hydrolase superfamily lysophospholipase